MDSRTQLIVAIGGMLIGLPGAALAAAELGWLPALGIAVIGLGTSALALRSYVGDREERWERQLHHFRDDVDRLAALVHRAYKQWQPSRTFMPERWRDAVDRANWILEVPTPVMWDDMPSETGLLEFADTLVGKGAAGVGPITRESLLETAELEVLGQIQRRIKVFFETCERRSSRSRAYSAFIERRVRRQQTPILKLVMYLEIARQWVVWDELDLTQRNYLELAKLATDWRKKERREAIQERE